MRRACLLSVLCLLLSAWSAVAADLALNAQPKVVPAVAFSDRDGHPLGLDAFKGKVVVLDYWATWCAPCRVEFPRLDALQGRLADKGAVVVAVSLDRGGMRVIDRFYDEMHVAHLAKYHDADGSGARAFGIFGMPTTVVIDKKGREVARVEGAIAWDSPDVVAVLERLVAAD
ncbi:TlpA disulfide reductase family protein [Telmatospirillum sp.]|uniref:TlpA family protein disulfide reductase n=1 Tax=Telmatospirillum sp. TaxID=2079197 RepID=UPI00284E23B4|nr:TlpA disulfide reductase family protein [Telmatospirillum sp.]MDR3440071.1 TlpA disulfide reductase family protein [Telmatospirillum sp.]